MRLADFDFDLPEDRIALEPARPRDAARLLVIRPDGLEDRVFRDLPDLLAPGDLLVFNDTRVIPAQLSGLRFRDGVEEGARIGVTLIRRADDSTWRGLARPAKRLAPGDRVRFGGTGAVCVMATLDATVIGREGAEVELAFDLSGTALDEAIANVGAMPLPPYIAAKRPVADSDAADYQTIYARREGAVAAPTAGLHFTDRVFADLEARGVSKAFVTLHVGPGTFLPVTVDEIANHKMHAEWGEISAETAARIAETRARGGRIVAVGTTALRLLESAVDEAGTVRPFLGETAIFIAPGHRIRSADALITNFHLPRSTLFMLVSAFAGLERMRAAYAHAIESGYRFFSYGDASLIFPETPR